MASHPVHPEDDLTEEQKQLLRERLKHIDELEKTAQPWREAMREDSAKLKQPAPK